MAQENQSDIKLPDPVEVSKSMTRLAERSQKLVNEFIQRQGQQGGSPVDLASVGQAFLDMTTRMLANPEKLIQAQMALWQDYITLWQSTTRRMLGEETTPIVKPSPDDRRFKDPAWDENALFDYIKQSYLLTARWMQSTVRGVEGLDPKTSKKLDFYTRQFVDAVAPSNFAATNPQVLRATVESGGENLIKGLENLLSDLERGNGQLLIRMTDENAFKVGENIAVTPGKVVYQNDLMQLLQYTPSTETVFRRPLMIMPPWINKYYILDLRPSNSFIKWAVDQGHTVFVLSWVNPDERHANKTFEDYMVEGPLDALDQITKITGEEQVNAIGYCLGGTLLASTLAYMASQNDNRIKSATYFTALVDFTEVGELSVFIDEEQLAALERRMSEHGYLDADALHTTFNMLRANDLIWSFVVNNYLLGKDPFPFDLLYWNSDSTRMPAAMHSFYLRNMYQKNLLATPGGITLKNTPIDVTQIKTPTFMMACREDHIAPWVGAYAATQLYKGPVKFVLAASGHIAGVVNPPAAQKYHHWVNPKLPKSAEAWLESAEQVPGSWWPEWQKWVARHGGKKVPARVPGESPLGAIEDAPGSYAMVRVLGHVQSEPGEPTSVAVAAAAVG